MTRAPLPTGRGPGDPYRNPFRSARVTPSRIDQGVDYFAPAGDPIYALGPGVVDQVYAGQSGWPGGGWVSYLLTAGPARGQRVFVAEDVAPEVSVGQRVNTSTVIGRFNQSGSIETGWAGPLKLGDQTLAAHLNEWDTTGGDPGRYSTEAGVTFSNLIASLGGPAGHLTPGGIRGPNQAIVQVPVDQTTPGGSPGAAGSQGGGSGCLIRMPSLGPIGGGCLLNTSQARAIIGGGLVLVALPVGIVGAIVLAAFAFRRSGAGAGIGRAAEVAGAGIAFIPGAEGAGAAVAAAGSAERRAVNRRQAERTQRETSQREAREGRQYDEVMARGRDSARGPAVRDDDEPPF